MYRNISPWTTENPIFLHLTSTDPEKIKTAVDQCAEIGYEMIILSFGSGLNMEKESEVYYQKFKELTLNIARTYSSPLHHVFLI